MIFVTVGAQMPFDRLIGWVDDWAEAEGRDDVVAQIGPSEFAPCRLEVVPFMTPPEFRARVDAAHLVIAHAGMGSIIEVLQTGKPLVVVPRYGDRGETRNDHQVVSARRLSQEGLIHMAETPEELARVVAELESQPPDKRIASHAQEGLLDRIRDYAVGA